MALANNDGTENEDKLNNLYRALMDLELVTDHNVDDRINFRIFLTICRDIFGLSTFEIDDTVEDVLIEPMVLYSMAPDAEEAFEYAEDEQLLEASPHVPATDPNLLSAIQERTEEQQDEDHAAGEADPYQEELVEELDAEELEEAQIPSEDVTPIVGGD